MARVTIEDCLDKVENRFELVKLASERARQLAQGLPSALPQDQQGDTDKPILTALREIELGLVDADAVAEARLNCYVDESDTRA